MVDTKAVLDRMAMTESIPQLVTSVSFVTFFYNANLYQKAVFFVLLVSGIHTTTSSIVVFCVTWFWNTSTSQASCLKCLFVG